MFYLTFNNRVLVTNLERSMGDLRYQTLNVGAKTMPLSYHQWIDGVRNKSFAGVNHKANDPGSDCYHEALTFDATISYYNW